MAEISLLSNASDVRIGDRAVVQIAGGDQITVHNDMRTDSPWVTLSGNTYRRIPMGDIIINRNVSSQVLQVTIDSQRRTSRSETSQQPESKLIKVRTTKQHVEILNLSGKFTSIIVEVAEDGRVEDLQTVVDRICQEMSSQRSPLLPQLVGMGWSERPIFIVHDELANGLEYGFQCAAEGNLTAIHYLVHTLVTSLLALCEYKTLTIPWNFWTFNPRTHVWQYDVSSAAVSLPESDNTILILYIPTPLRQDTRPRLDTDEIVACFEDHFGDFLYTVASLGHAKRVEDLSDFVRHRLLTFGAVVSRNKPGILAHLPSTLSPKWDCWSWSDDVKASYSSTIPSRVDLSFRNTDHNRINVHFSLGYPNPLQHRLAYLSQSIPFFEDCPDNDIVLIDAVRFSLVGTFHHNLATSSIPVYLFVLPIPLEKINNLYCIRYPLLHPSFYWSSDPNGHSIICEDDWASYGIPRLEVLTWIGSLWYRYEYQLVRGHLKSKKFPLDGRQYARAHGYPELIHGDPHNPRINVIEELNEGEDSDSSAWTLQCQAVASSDKGPNDSSDDDTPNNIEQALDRVHEVVGHHEIEAVPLQDIQEGANKHVVPETAPMLPQPAQDEKSRRAAMRKAPNRIPAFCSTLANCCRRIFVGRRRRRKGDSTHWASEEDR
ncbi:hypothetical protein PM082_022871 [Marasmius tenuissimus]|nr:hypothetical protein PM082_022871 [Marasmius tenuissimus]